jgi:GT2 family glycosyltransferase
VCEVRVSAVVLYYRHWPGILTTLDALIRQTHPLNEVVVVDNASADGSGGRISAVYPAVRVAEAPNNGGYGAGMNQGMRSIALSDAEAVLLITHECRLAATALEGLVARLEASTGVGIAGPLLGYASSPDTVFSAGGEFDDRWWPVHMHQGTALENWENAEPHAVAHIDGAALLVRREVIECVGVFDEEYFLYFEETEYCTRARKAGWTVECVPVAIAWQEPGPYNEYLMTRNWLRFLRRNAPRRVVLAQVMHLTIQALRPKHRGNSRVARRRAGLIDFLLGRYGRRAQ